MPVAAAVPANKIRTLGSRMKVGVECMRGTQVLVSGADGTVDRVQISPIHYP